MPKTKVALTLDADLLEQVDSLVAQQQFRSRSQRLKPRWRTSCDDWRERGLPERPQSSTRRRRSASPTKAWPTRLTGGPSN